jgi:2-hydroxychromene-2-carboxylate isomerase
VRLDVEIIHYFAPISGYAYLGIAALREMAARHGCSLVHAPVDIQAVFVASGVTPPAVQSEAKKAYRIADMQLARERRAGFALYPCGRRPVR